MAGRGDMRKILVVLVVAIIGTLFGSPAIAQAFNYTFGGANDASANRLLAAFGSLSTTCGNPMTDFQAMVTLDASTSPPTVVLTEVGKGPFGMGPVTRIDWMKDLRPNEFGRAVPIVALLAVKFRWGSNNAGDGQLALSGPEGDLILKGGGKTWAFVCRHIVAAYQCVPGAPGCN